MVELKQDNEVKLKTEAQDALIAKVMETSQLTKTERDYIVDKIAGKLITSYDASVLISYLLTKIKFMNHFNGKRKHKVAECYRCGEKIAVKRYEEVGTGIRHWFCSICKPTVELGNYIEVKKNKAVEPTTKTIITPINKVMVGLDENGELKTIETGEVEEGMFKITKKAIEPTDDADYSFEEEQLRHSDCEVIPYDDQRW